MDLLGYLLHLKIVRSLTPSSCSFTHLFLAIDNFLNWTAHFILSTFNKDTLNPVS